jgi:hypothetical protein
MISQARWRQPRFNLRYRQEFARSASGRLQGKDLGPPVWEAEFDSVPLGLGAADGLMADFLSLGGLRQSFLAYDPVRPAPLSVQGGSLSALQSASVVAAFISTDRARVRLEGLPAGFVISRGDRLGLRGVTGREYLFAVSEGAVASGLGVAGPFTVSPSVPVSIAAGAVATLIKPMIEMRLVPGSLDDPYVDLSHRRIVFRAVEV